MGWSDSLVDSVLGHGPGMPGMGWSDGLVDSVLGLGPGVSGMGRSDGLVDRVLGLGASLRSQRLGPLSAQLQTADLSVIETQRRTELNELFWRTLCLFWSHGHHNIDQSVSVESSLFSGQSWSVALLSTDWPEPAHLVWGGTLVPVAPTYISYRLEWRSLCRSASQVLTWRSAWGGYQSVYWWVNSVTMTENHSLTYPSLIRWRPIMTLLRGNVSVTVSVATTGVIFLLLVLCA